MFAIGRDDYFINWQPVSLAVVAHTNNGMVIPFPSHGLAAVLGWAYTYCIYGTLFIFIYAHPYSTILFGS